ncbi:glycoside hydrolase family 25 protein [Flavobacterium sp.]|uniref:glycoside hydrolase family 25 protein n=1 Tax=Flavobacterium sp. TaxID=239 RepID=UPI002A7F27C9|nr:glycoside hydrolase family 25 protein [Flavobacterium sp.]
MVLKKTTKKKTTNYKYKIIASGILLLMVIIIGFAYKTRFLSYLGFIPEKPYSELSKEERKLSNEHIEKVLLHHDEKALGFDVSEYQSVIDWEKTYNIDESFELSFVFIRATAGNNKVDSRFKENWKNAKRRNLICGAYHYYRPNENSIEQANNFIKTVKLRKGDLPPVLDIEKLPKTQSIANLKLGLRRWLETVEKHYKVKPIIYSGESYYNDFLKKEFSDYPFWIANYNFWTKEIKDEWDFWQFTENGEVEGVKGRLDLNVYNGSVLSLQNKCIK